MTLAQLLVVLRLDSGPFRAGMVSAMNQIGVFQRGMGKLTSGQSLQNIGRGLTYGLTIPLLAAGVAIGAFGSQLTGEMARVQSVIATSTNNGAAQIARWTDEVQALGVTLGRTSPEVAGGLYEIVSAFGNLSNATEFLEVAGRAAVAGQSDIVQSTKNLVLATRAWGDSSTVAVQRMADLNSATVRVGTLTESELGPAMAGLLPIMRLYNVRLEEGFAGLASLAGVSGSASQASTQLQRAITSLVAPNTTLAKLYKANGIESGKLLIEQRGLVGAFQEIVRISEATGTPLQKMLGRIEGLKAIATLTGPQLKAFNDNLEAMSNAAGSVDTAFAGATQGISNTEFQWSQAIQRMRVIFEDLYQAFGPAALRVADSLAPIGKAFEGLAQAVASLDTGTLTGVLYGLLGLAALGPTLSVIGSLTSLLSGLWSVLQLVNPYILAASVAIGALLTGIVVTDNMRNVAQWFSRLADGVGDAIQKIKQGNWADAFLILRTTFDQAARGVVSAAGHLGRDIAGAIERGAGPVGSTLFGWLTTGYNEAARQITQTPIKVTIEPTTVTAESAGATAGGWLGSGLGTLNRWTEQLSQALKPLGDAATRFARSVNDTLTNMLKNFDPATAWAGAVAKIKSWWTSLSTTVTQMAKDFSKGFSSTFQREFNLALSGGAPGGQRALSPLAESFQNQGAVLTATLKQTISSIDFGTVLQPISAGIEKTMPNATKPITTGMIKAINDVRTAVATSNLPSTMTTEAGKMSKAFADSLKGLPKSATATANSTKAAFLGANWNSVGSSIAHGVASGITAGTGAIASAARVAALAAVSSAKAAIQAKSPSVRAINEIGIPFSQGIAIGITRGMPLIGQAAARAWDHMDNGVASGRPRVAFAGAGGGDTHTTIEITFGDIIVNGGSAEAGKTVAESITQALRSRGLI